MISAAVLVSLDSIFVVVGFELFGWGLTLKHLITLLAFFSIQLWLSKPGFERYVSRTREIWRFNNSYFI